MSKKHIVAYSGGVSSFFAAKRVVEKFGKEDVILVFCDTKIEDEDLYRFLDETVEYLGVEFVRLCDGRTPFQIFKDEKLMGSTRLDPCSKILKRWTFERYLKKNFKPNNCIIYVGFNWDEIHRFDRTRKRNLETTGFVYEAPLIEKPYLDKDDMFRILEDEIGIEIPRLYKIGLWHNNCGGFCVKAGQKHYKLLYKGFKERYLEIEEKEEDVYRAIGKRHPFLRVEGKGKIHYISLRDFRENFLDNNSKEKQQEFLEEYGGCGCF